MATDSISVTYTADKTVSASIGITVTQDGLMFFSWPSDSPRLIRDILRKALNRIQGEVDDGTIDDTETILVNHFASGGLT